MMMATFQTLLDSTAAIICHSVLQDSGTKIVLNTRFMGRQLTILSGYQEQNMGLLVEFE